MKFLLKSAFVLSLLLVLPSAPAGLMIEVGDLKESSPGAGSFEVWLSNTDAAGTPAYEISSFAFQLVAPSGSSLVFTSASANGLAVPYLFEGVGFVPVFGLPLSYDVPGSDVTASDDNFLGPDISADLVPYTPVGPGSRYSLGRLEFTADILELVAGIEVRFGSSTRLSDASTIPTGLDVTASNFTIQFGSSAVPEPSSLVMVGLAGILMLGGVHRRRSRD